MGSLLSGLLGGGGSLSPSSSTAQSSPFYNDSGIYFNSPGSGNTSGNASDATSTDPSRLNIGGNQALPASQLTYPTVAAGTATNSNLFLIFGGVAALGLVAFFIFKK